MHLSNAKLSSSVFGLVRIPLDQRPALSGVGILNEVSLIHFFGQFKLAAIHLIPVVVVFFFYGEFDPGSG